MHYKAYYSADDADGKLADSFVITYSHVDTTVKNVPTCDRAEGPMLNTKASYTVVMIKMTMMVEVMMNIMTMIIMMMMMIMAKVIIRCG